MKKVLILCTGNSCRSIIAEAIINKVLKGKVQAYSSGTKPSGKVNPNAKKVLIQNNCWDEKYHSKVLDEVMHINYDLVITVCDNAKESCPIFKTDTKVIHIGFEDPDGKEYEAFQECYELIAQKLLPIVTEY